MVMVKRSRNHSSLVNGKLDGIWCRSTPMWYAFCRISCIGLVLIPSFSVHFLLGSIPRLLFSYLLSRKVPYYTESPLHGEFYYYLGLLLLWLVGFFLLWKFVSTMVGWLVGFFLQWIFLGNSLILRWFLISWFLFLGSPSSVHFLNFVVG